MTGRPDQAGARASGVQRRRMAQLAERVANGATVATAGKLIGLTAGETAAVWLAVKRAVGMERCR